MIKVLKRRVEEFLTCEEERKREGQYEQTEQNLVAQEMLDLKCAHNYQFIEQTKTKN